MKKIKLPKNPHKGMKIYCHKCKRDNPTCNHFDIHRYKVKIHIEGSNNKKKTKVLTATDYDEAVKQAIEFRQELKLNNYFLEQVVEVSNDYSILDAVIHYQRYLAGNHRYSHKVKNVGKEYQKECMRYCRYFLDDVKKYKDVVKNRIVDINQLDVARFYTWAEGHYAPKTFNKCMGELKAFFKFLITVEEIEMKNPFEVYESKSLGTKKVTTLTKDEYERIINSIGNADPYVVLGGKGERKNMFKPYLVEGFKLFLLTGGRREEVVDLRWSDIITSIDGVKFFKILNLKVSRIKKTEESNEYEKYIPINNDLLELLNQLGYESKKNSNEFILYPERMVTSKTIMNDMSKAFTHYRKAAGVNNDVSLKTLRKTYITWVNKVMGKSTGLLTGHSGEQVLKDHYIDSLVLNNIEKAALEIKIFGT